MYVDCRGDGLVNQLCRHCHPHQHTRTHSYAEGLISLCCCFGQKKECKISCPLLLCLVNSVLQSCTKPLHPQGEMSVWELLTQNLVLKTLRQTNKNPCLNCLPTYLVFSSLEYHDRWEKDTSNLREDRDNAEIFSESMRRNRVVCIPNPSLRNNVLHSSGMRMLNPQQATDII